MENNYTEDTSFQTPEWADKNHNPTVSTFTNNSKIDNLEDKCQKYVLENAKPNDITSGIKIIDQFCGKYWMMNLGPIKPFIIKPYLEKVKPKKILELGGYCGYSSLVFAEMAPYAKIYSIEIDEHYANISRSIQKHAGVADRVEVKVGTIQTSEQYIKQTGPFDFIFIDHEKTVYLQDLKLLEQWGAIKQGTLIAGDNIIMPGAPDYLKYFQTEVLEKYRSTLYHCFIEYSTTMKDALLMSEKV